VQEIRQRLGWHQPGQPVALVQADHDGLRVGFTGQPHQRVRDRPVVGDRLPVGGQPRLPGQRGAPFRELPRPLGGRQLRLEPGAHVSGAGPGRLFQRPLGQGRRFEAATGFPDEDHERGLRGEQGGGLPDGPLRGGRAIEADDYRACAHCRTFRSWPPARLVTATAASIAPA
jgi:hypothetical protein